MDTWICARPDEQAVIVNSLIMIGNNLDNPQSFFGGIQQGSGTDKIKDCLEDFIQAAFFVNRFD